ncbi:hypothetical protein LCGC14_0016940 [marine sediment metagenome]|uniref:DegT/DnrJ/EryC1/StrS family aminotransferase n=1 Tax=marine sediment metagenome TaxID=412755 RepID=A0A0F9WFE7_9ZZZZ|nr:aminotransferase class I/II-fold pyridoxal phosphate-dependent enzyme [Phycisphaerae bacterium]HDZ42402.1 aminotransferase class I/II-fold pyridoxal phosphate-dependent enzyme [Phycisphaerae bacterium]
MADKLAILGGPKAMTVPWPDNGTIGPDEIAAATRTVASGQISDCGRGETVAAMEDAFAARFAARHALSFSSGTASIHGALFAAGVRPGTEVLTANQTWASAITAIFHAGGTPVFCDVARDSFHIDPAELQRKCGPDTRAVIVTHLWGIPADMDPILKAARLLNLKVIEDCSHAHGAEYKGTPVGTLGDIGCFSLQGSKAIVAGEGGILVTNSRRLYQRAMIPGHHDMRLSVELVSPDLKPFAECGGYWKYRISPVGAAIATVQLGRMDELNGNRQGNFDILHRRLRKTAALLTWPKLNRGSRRGWYGTPALYEDLHGRVSRDLFAAACAAEGLYVGRAYSNWYRTPVFQDLKLMSQLWTVEHPNGVKYTPLGEGALPNDESVRQRLLVFPIPPLAAPEFMTQVAGTVEKVAANMASLSRFGAEHKSKGVPGCAY